jgi:hypothetical protein
VRLLLLAQSSHAYDDRSRSIIDECRGLILDADSAPLPWAVVAFPYRRFYNFAEKQAAPLDWTPIASASSGAASSAAASGAGNSAGVRVFEKVDGSLMTLYAHAGAWHVASSGMPDASGSAGGQRSMHDLFFQIWNELK